jgi:folate-binding protein YgfZ
MVKGVICQLSQFELIHFFGEEAQVFLHNQLTCDVAGLKPGGSTYGGYCTPKGRVLATFLLWRSEHGFFLQLPSPLREPIRKQISKYILRSRVKAADASADWAIYGVAGKDASALVQRATGLAPKAVHGVVHSADTMVIRLPGDRYQIVAAREKAVWIRELLAADAETTDPDYWEWLDIRAGVPVILLATQEEFVPQMVNLDLIGGVSFEKGCYPGQEIVSRMHHRGTLKQRMYLASIASNGRPQPADKLYSPDFGEQACGTIVNATRSPEGGYDALAVIQVSSAERGEVRLKSPAGPALKLLPLPYLVTSDE